MVRVNVLQLAWKVSNNICLFKQLFHMDTPVSSTRHSKKHYLIYLPVTLSATYFPSLLHLTLHVIMRPHTQSTATTDTEKHTTQKSRGMCFYVAVVCKVTAIIFTCASGETVKPESCEGTSGSHAPI